ncbi:metallophosphoesterase [Niabella aquatica]
MVINYKKHFFSFLLSGVVLIGCTVQRNLNKPFFFIQMRDPQFGFFTADKDFAKETDNFGMAIATANRLHPAFLIVTGDLINHPGDPVLLAGYQGIAARPDSAIKLYNIPGNHDITNHPAPATLDAYRKRFGPDYYIFRQGKLFDIVLNSTLNADPSGATDAAAGQDKWLLKALQQAKASGCKHIVVFQHHPWFLKDPGEKDGYYNITIKRHKKYLQLLSDYGVSYIFAEYLYYSSFGKFGSTGSIGRPLGKDPSGFRMVIAGADHIEYQYYSLDSIPSEVKS